MKVSGGNQKKTPNKNHVTTVNVLIGDFPRTMGGANLVFSGLCLIIVPHFCGTSVAQAEIDRIAYTRFLPNHTHT